MSWQVNNTSAAAGTATVAQAAGGPNTRWVINSITASLAAGAAVQGPLTASVIQDAGGTPVTLWAASLSAPANSSAVVALAGLWIEQTVAGKTLTIQFSGAGATNTIQSVAMSGGATSG